MYKKNKEREKKTLIAGSKNGIVLLICLLSWKIMAEEPI